MIHGGEEVQQNANSGCRGKAARGPRVKLQRARQECGGSAAGSKPVFTFSS